MIPSPLYTLEGSYLFSLIPSPLISFLFFFFHRFLHWRTQFDISIDSMLNFSYFVPLLALTVRGVLAAQSSK